MNPRWTAFLAGCLLALAALGDVTVNFRNNVLPGDAKVSFGWNYLGVPFGSPVVNGLGGRSFVAQLFWFNGQELLPVGAPANFRDVSQYDSLAGTWSGANRTIIGPPADATVNLVVRVWDASFATFEAARSGGGGAGQSAVFTYRNALSSPPVGTDTYMVNFRGFELGPLTPPCPDPEPIRMSVPEGGLVPLAFPFLSWSIGEMITPLNGKITGTWETGHQYQAPANYYGVDEFVVQEGATPPYYCNPPYRIIVTIQPSPVRTAGWLVLQGATNPAPFLLGLTNQSYEIQASADLKDWLPLTRVSGTNGLVHLDAGLPGAGETRFLRAVNVTP